MAFLTKDQVKGIIQNAPPGTSPGGIVAALRTQGHTLEGYSEAQPPKPSVDALGNENVGFGKSKFVQALDKVSGLFKSTGKFFGGALLNATNLAASKSQDVAQMNSSNEALNSEDQAAIQKAHILAQQGQKDEAMKLLNIVRSHGSNITLNDILPNSQQNNVEQIAGAGLGTAAELGSFATGGGGATAAGKVLEAKTVGAGAIQGIKTGAAAGGAYGAAQAAGEAMQQDKSASDVLKEGATGAVTGAAVGAALGGVTGAVSGGLAARAERAKVKVSREAYDVIAPELTRTEKIAALDSGRGTLGPDGEIVLTPSKRDLEVAQTAQGIVSSKKTSVENIMALRGEIKKEAETTIAGLKNNNAIFNKNTLAAHLETIEKPPLLASDERLNNAYELAKKKFLEFTDNHPKNLSGLLEARKEFDAWAQKAFPKIFDDVNQAPLQSALKDMRSAANDFIAEKLPAGSPFRASLKKQNLLYEAVDNIASKSYKDVGTSKLQRFVKNNPNVVTGAKIAAGAIGVGGVLKGAKEIINP